MVFEEVIVSYEIVIIDGGVLVGDYDFIGDVVCNVDEMFFNKVK